MSQPRKMVPDREFAPVPKARNGRQVHYLTASIAAGVLALLGGCGEKIEAEPPFVSPDPFEARVKRELFELKSKLDEVQTGQAILVEALSRQNFEIVSQPVV